MRKKKLALEYPLRAGKQELLWQLLSTDHGLERWLADKVEEEDGVMHLTWGDPWGEHHTMHANVLEKNRNNNIRLRWSDEDDPDAFWEMRIMRSELTNELCLCVVDYAYADDIDDLQELWDGNLERLHQSSGF